MTEQFEFLVVPATRGLKCVYFMTKMTPMACRRANLDSMLARVRSSVVLVFPSLLHAHIPNYSLRFLSFPFTVVVLTVIVIVVVVVVVVFHLIAIHPLLFLPPQAQPKTPRTPWAVDIFCLL